MWHLQLALFFVAASFLAMGIFLAPMIAGREPKHQDKLAIVLFGAVVVVVAGQPGRRGGQHQGLHHRERPLVLDRRAGLGVPRPRAALADPADRRHGASGW